MNGAPSTERVFAVSWLSYFSYYFTRKHFSVVKSSLPLTEVAMQWIDFAYLLGYMFGQFRGGHLSERIGPRRLVTMGMLTSAAVSLAFAAIGAWWGAVAFLFVALSAANGVAQATGWPGNSRLMTTWIPPARRGEVMGLWATSYQAGGLAATYCAGLILGIAAWPWVYVVMATWVAVVAWVYWAIIRDAPPTAAATTTEKPPADVAAVWRRLLRTPMTYSFGACYFALKLMRYGFLFWLPYYLATSLGFDKVAAATMAVAFELGGIPAVILTGSLADRVFGRRRIAVAIVCGVGLVVALALYRSLGANSATHNVVLLLAIGAALFSVDALVSGAATQDLGGPDGAGLASGLINGMGSAGAVVQSLVLVAVKNAYGWDGVFAMFEGMAVVATLVLLPFWRTRGDTTVNSAG